MIDPPDREVAVFSAARRLPPSQRAAFLDEACAGDAALRQRVEELLQASEEAGAFLQSPAADAPGPGGTIRVRVFPAEKLGDRVGRYKILQQIGEGGCGVVYMAEQEEPVRRRVALKVIKLGMDTKSVIARFAAERQALAMMDHPNIAKVLDVGATDTGRPYFVMELVRGIKITDYCDQNNLSTRERLDLFIQVCRAVQHAHQKGVIHRDIKPSNILVTVNDGVPMPKVIDFGIAKATQGRLTDRTLFTAFEQFIGTPAYMSPEQAVMTSLDIDTRSDIYSLGVLLYELLTGKTPFDAKALLQAGLDAMRRTILEVEPPKPSARLSTMLDAERATTASHRQTEPPKLIHLLKGDLDWIVMKCLEKDRTRRYETANGLAADIKRHLNTEPVVARPPSKLYEFQKSVRRHKFGFATAAALVTVLAVGLLVSAREAARANREARRALQAEAVAKERLAESQAVSKLMIGVFQSPDPARNGRTITVAETLDRAVTNLDRDLAAQPALRAQLQATLGGTYYALGLYREAIPLEEKLYDYYLKNLGMENTNTLRAMAVVANCYDEAGRRDEALKLREQVLALFRKVHGPEHPNTLRAMHSLADSYFEGGRNDEALKLYEQVLTLDRKVLGPELPETLNVMNNLAGCYRIAGREEEALKLREQVLALRRKVNGLEHPDTLRAMRGLAISYATAGRNEEALKLREELLTLDRKVLGPEHPDTLSAMNDLANSYANAGRNDEALKLREQVLALFRKVLGPEHPDTLSAMHNLANSYANAGRNDEALKLREQVLALFRKVLGPEHPNTLSTMNDLAQMLAISDVATIRNGTKAVQLAETAVAATSRKNWDFLDTLAAAYAETQQFDKAVAAEREAIGLLKTGPEKKDCVSRLNLYLANKPYHEPRNP
jgi:serine/threonine protein kinase/tetratricopeptide (TPR) repeat protein